MKSWAERVMVAESAVRCGHLGGCGCEAYRGCCERCPLPEDACDYPTSYVTYVRNTQMRGLKQGGMPVPDIANMFDMSARNAFRILAGADIST